MEQHLHGRWFDGKSSRPRDVQVHLQPSPKGPSLRLEPLEPGAAALTLARRQVGWPEAWSAQRAPRTLVVDLREHGSLEINDVSGWQAALAQSGASAPLAQRMQTRWTVFLGVALVAGAALWAFYRWGTPWAATQLTRQVPLQWETNLTERAMADLDQSWLKPSKLPAARQAELRARFEALANQVSPDMRRYRGYAPRLNLQFRSGFGANAFALPGGTIVMTDGLVEAAAKRGLPDDALVGVLAHEIGHVMHRHTTRMVVEQGVLNVGLGLALGDVSTAVSFGSSLLTGLAYRRSHETEADCFALALMRRSGLPTTPMAELLLQLDGGPTKQASGSQTADAARAVVTLLSSHPDTAGRASKLKQGQAEACH
jgi:Zn-dependent protease with chaperone function